MPLIRLRQNEINSNLIGTTVRYIPSTSRRLVTLTPGRDYRVSSWEDWGSLVLLINDRGNAAWYTYKHFCYAHSSLKSRSSGFKKFQEKLRIAV